jgi:hypothetical protein
MNIIKLFNLLQFKTNKDLTIEFKKINLLEGGICYCFMCYFKNKEIHKASILNPKNKKDAKKRYITILLEEICLSYLENIFIDKPSLN